MSGSHLTPSPALQALLHSISRRCDRQHAWLRVGDGSPARTVSRARR
jgi:hypothetical protein